MVVGNGHSDCVKATMRWTMAVQLVATMLCGRKLFSQSFVESGLIGVGWHQQW